MKRSMLIVLLVVTGQGCSTAPRPLPAAQSMTQPDPYDLQHDKEMQARHATGVIHVGEHWSEPLPAHDAGTPVVISSGPTGLAVRGEQITWTPGPQDVGIKLIEVTYQSGGASRMHRRQVVVRQRNVQLSFTPTQIAISPDGRFALAADLLVSDDTGRALVLPRQEVKGRMAVIDLSRDIVLVERAFDDSFGASARQVALDDENVYVTLRNPAACVVLSKQTLAEQKRDTLSTDMHFIRVAGRRLLMKPQEDAAAWTAFDPKTLQPFLRGAEPEPLLQNRVPPDPWKGVGWLYRRVVYDPTFNSPLAIGKLPNIPLISNELYLPDDPYFAGDVFPPHRVSHEPTVLMSDGVELRLQTSPQRRRPNNDPGMYAVLQMTTHFGQKPRELMLMDEIPSGGKPADPRDMSLDATPQMAIARLQQRLFILPRASWDLTGYQPPLRVVPNPAVFVIDPEKPTKLTYQISGGKPPYVSSLAGRLPGIGIDQDSGTITIDPILLRQGAAKRLEQQRQQRQIAMTNYRAGQALDQVLAVSDEGGDGEFTALTGYTPNGILWLVPVGQLVRDADNGVVELVHAVAIDLPGVPIREALARAKVASPESSPKPSQPPPPTAPVSGSVVRIQELERRNAELKAELKRLEETKSDLPDKK